MRVRSLPYLWIAALGILFQFFLSREVYPQNRNTPEVTQLFQKIDHRPDGTQGAEYWIEYKPCAGAEHCFVRVTAPNDRTLERIKKKDRDETQNTQYYRWKVDGITLDDIGDVDGEVWNALPD